VSKAIRELITTTEAAKLLGRQVITIHDLIERGALQSFHIKTKGTVLPWRTMVLKSEVETLAVEGWQPPRRMVGRKAQ
jgi:hypothetical protein